MRRIFPCFLIALSGMMASGALYSQSSPKSGEDKLPTIAKKARNCRLHRGFFNFYWDERAGRVLLEIPRLDTEFLFQTYLAAGLGSNDLGLDRAMEGPGSIVKFTRTGNKVMMVEPNLSFRAINGSSSEKRSVEESFAQSILWGFTIEAQTGDTVLVDATNFFLSDQVNIISTLSVNHQGTYSIDASRSSIYLPATKNFDRNTEIESTLTFTGGGDKPGDLVSSVAPSPNAIALRVHFSFVQLPDNNYKPRVSDSRAGYFTSSFLDYSTPVSEPIQKFYLLRHRLQKKDPSAALSEPVKPIIYYLDNGTPEPIRSALLEGASWWSQAFEAAGFKNAFQVQILPDSADPMDIQYNMINWIHRSTRGWSYGGSVIDPRTGEIIKGNVRLGSLRVRQDYLIAQGLLAPFANGALPPDPNVNPMMKMALQRLRQLAAHEVGHTLGLLHNYIASAEGRASVMDYPHPLIHLDPQGNIDLSEAYTNEIGDWDKVAIICGYGDPSPGMDVMTWMDKIIKEAAAKGLTFISDRDARDAGGLHPNAHLWDNGRDPVTALRDLMKVRSKALEQFGAANIRPGDPMASLEDVLVPVYLMHRYQLEAASKVVGGLYYSYATRGDGQLVTRYVSKEEQMNALLALADCISPAFLSLPDTITRLIPPRPAQYDYTRELFNRRTGLLFDPLGAAETATDMAYGFLFNTARLNRMAQNKAENGGLSVAEMISVLVDRTWQAPALKGFPELIRQQNALMLLSRLLAVSIDEKASFAARSQVMPAIQHIQRLVESKLSVQTKDAGGAPSASDEDLGYLILARDRLKNPKETGAIGTPLALPPGSPIGDDCEYD